MDRPRVLVVDDDADDGEFMRDALSSWNYDVTHVASGREAVDLISHHGAERRRAERFKVVPYEIPRGCAAAFIWFPCR